MCVDALCAEQDGLPVVREIVVVSQGVGRVDTAFVLSQTAAAKGAPLDRRTVSRDVKTLLDTGLFSHAGAEVEPVSDGVRLIYSVRRKLKLAGPLEIEGAGHIRESKIRDIVDLHPGDRIDSQVVGVRVLEVIKEYHEDYFANAKIESEIRETDPTNGLGSVLLIVKEGKRGRMRRFLFSGNERVSSSELWRVVEPRGWWHPMRWFDRRRYDADKLEIARLGIASLYLDRGFLDVRVEGPLVEPMEDGLSVTFTVREGVAYRFGRITISGVERFPEAELWALVTIKEGEPASSRAMRRVTRSLSDYYGRRGYIAARVAPALNARADGELVDVRFAITEGEQTRIRNVLIRGNMRTKDKVIRRELLVYPGEIFDRDRIRRSERRVTNLGFFSHVRSHITDTPLPDEKDLVLEVEGKRTGQFMLGAGFSSIDNIMGFVELSQGNFDIKGWPYFTGAGQKLKLRAQISDSRQSYDLSFVEPWFLDQKLSLGLDVYRLDRDYGDYDVERTGAALSLTKPLPGPNRIQLRYELQGTVISDVSDTNTYFYVDSTNELYSFVLEEDTLKSTIGVTLRHDTRNNAFIPTKGNRVSLTASISGGLLGGDTDIYALGLRTSHYFPLWLKHVISLRTRYEVVGEYDDAGEVPIDDRLFLGGGRTLRGFDYRDVGPKVRPVGLAAGDRSYRPVGGQSLAMATVEYTIPLVSGLRLAVFYDTGNVWREPYEIDLNDLASSAGVGVRLDLPGFPIRIDRAWIIERDDDLTDDDPWVIWIGYDY